MTASAFAVGCKMVAKQISRSLKVVHSPYVDVFMSDGWLLEVRVYYCTWLLVGSSQLQVHYMEERFFGSRQPRRYTTRWRGCYP